MSPLRRLLELGTERPDVQADFIRARHIRFSNAASLIICGFIVQNAALALYHHQSRLLVVYLLHFVGIFGVLLFNQRGRPVLAGAWFGAVALGFVSLYALLFGVESLNFVFLPMIALMQFFYLSYAERRLIALVVGLSALCFVAVLAIGRVTVPSLGVMPDGLIAAQRLNSLVGLLLLSIALGAFALVTIARADREVLSERDKTERLLHNILPKEVAAELKAKGYADAKQFDAVTVLFTDFKGFTTVAERLSPAALVEELNCCFKAFDRIVTAHGLEKIKTIGDAYMCAGGLPDPASSTPADVVDAALELQAFMIARKEERARRGEPFFEMRVGIHTGPVVAGIVGDKKFAYDIWGDTVNLASRMETSGEVGHVNLSESTYALVKDAVVERQGQATARFTFVPRGKVQAKGKGDLEMYFVT